MQSIFGAQLRTASRSKEFFCSSACSKGKFQQLSFAPSAVAKEIFCSSASSKGKFQRLSFAPPAVAKEIFCSSACSKGKFQQLSFACNCNQLELIVVCGYVACAQHVVYRRSKLYGFEMEAKARGSSCPRDGGACGRTVLARHQPVGTVCLWSLRFVACIQKFVLLNCWSYLTHLPLLLSLRSTSICRVSPSRRQLWQPERVTPRRHCPMWTRWQQWEIGAGTQATLLSK